jgi:hypothetical protein
MSPKSRSLSEQNGVTTLKAVFIMVLRYCVFDAIILSLYLKVKVVPVLN